MTISFSSLSASSGRPPAQMSADELHAEVRAAIAQVGAKGPKDMGAVMKALMPKVQGKAEGKAVSEAVKAELAPK